MKSKSQKRPITLRSPPFSSVPPATRSPAIEGPVPPPGVQAPRETSPPSASESSPLSPSEKALAAELVADGLSIQHKFHPEPEYKQTGKGHCASDTLEEIRRAKESKAKEKEP